MQMEYEHELNKLVIAKLFHMPTNESEMQINWYTLSINLLKYGKIDRN